MSKRLRFIRQTQLADIVGPPPKTRIWNVRNTESRITLGTVRWFSRWRQYSFFPDAELVFERTCLRAIADFCERATHKHRRINAEVKGGRGK